MSSKNESNKKKVSEETAVEVSDNRKRARAAKDVIDASVVSDIPVELSNNLSLVARKLSAFLSYYSAASLNRLNTLNRFISDAEDRLYNVDVQKLDMKELNARYKEAKRAQAEIMTIARQVSEQACEADSTARMDEIYNLLRGMSSDTLEQLKEALEEANTDN